MKRRFSEEQIIGLLREADAGLPVKGLCRQHGFSEASYYLWRGKFGGMNVPRMPSGSRSLRPRTADWRSCWPSRCWKRRWLARPCEKSGERTVTPRFGAPYDSRAA